VPSLQTRAGRGNLMALTMKERERRVSSMANLPPLRRIIAFIYLSMGNLLTNSLSGEECNS